MYNKYITEAFINNMMDNVNIIHRGKIVSQENVNAAFILSSATSAAL